MNGICFSRETSGCGYHDYNMYLFLNKHAKGKIYFSDVYRTLLSDAYKCQDAWTSRLSSPILSKVEFSKYSVVFFLSLLIPMMFVVVVFNSSFNNISVISWQSVLLVEETGVPGENHRPVISH